MKAVSLLNRSVFLFCAVLFVFLGIFCSRENLTGGGSDVGNPVVGTATLDNGTPAESAMIIIGTVGSAPVFDTTWCDSNGIFSFQNLLAGKYAVVAQKDSLSGIEKIVHDTLTQSDVEITLYAPMTITIYTDSIGSADEIISAKIAGTHFSFETDSLNNWVLKNAPAGRMDVYLYGEDSLSFEYQSLETKSECDVYMIADPSLPPEEWVTGDCGVRDPQGKPYITWMNPPDGSEGVIARLTSNYNMAVQFSHPMDTRKTANAVRIYSTDTLADSIQTWWQGADVLYIRFYSRYNLLPSYATSTSYQVGRQYGVVIDTTVETIFGVTKAQPETLSFTPEPNPRITQVSGFRFVASASNEVVDSLPDTVSLGDSISPTIAYQDGNDLNVTVKGTPVPDSLAGGISCFYNDTVPVPVIMSASGSSIKITFTEILRSGTDYCVIIDSTLRFEEGVPLPQEQRITWRTLNFTLNSAMLLGSYDYDSTIQLASSSYYKDFQMTSMGSISANLPYTTFYFSTLLDTSTILSNIIYPDYFTDNPIIIEDSKFGWKADTWLPPDTVFSFTILPGLKSQAGDSTTDTLQYSIKTEPFKLKQMNVMGLSNPYANGSYSPPIQDSIYEIPTGKIVTQYPNTMTYQIEQYSAFISFNLPLDYSSAREKFKLEPENNIAYYEDRTGNVKIYATDMLIPDTIYTLTLETGLQDTFGNQSADTFRYRFQTEDFALKIGNLFGVYFGYPEVVDSLPDQILPDISYIDQDVQPGEPVLFFLASSSPGGNSAYFSNYVLSPNPLGTLSDTAYLWVRDIGTYGNWIGVPVQQYMPGFDNSVNFLCFSGIPDSNDFRKFVKITPNDSSIQLKIENNNLRFSTTDYCKSNTNYSIKLESGFHDIYGRTLGDSFNVSFVTPAFLISQISMDNHSFTRDSVLAGIDSLTLSTRGFDYWFTTTYSLDLPSLVNHISIMPAISGTASADVNRFSFTSSEILVPDTVYTLTVSDSIKDQNNGYLDTTYTVSFRTEAFKLENILIGTTDGGELYTVYTNARIDSAGIGNSVTVSPSRYDSGVYELTEDSTGFSFVPDSTILFGDEIKIVVDSTLADIHGHTLGKRDSLSYIVTIDEW